MVYGSIPAPRAFPVAYTAVSCRNLQHCVGACLPMTKAIDMVSTTTVTGSRRLLGELRGVGLVLPDFARAPFR